MNDLADFSHQNSIDHVFREYDPPKLDCVTSSWKGGRPAKLRSWLLCTLYSFILTVLCGSGIAAIVSFVLWLSIHLGAICRRLDGTWYKMPIGIQKSLLTLEVAQCSTLQCWYLCIMLPIFGWKVIKKVNVVPWFIIVASIDAIYRLELNVYRRYNHTWSSYPMNFLFAATIFLVSYKVASQYQENIGQKFRLAFKLGAQFYVGFPVALILNYVVLYYFNIIPEKARAILASLSPALVVMSKAIARLCVEKIEGINHPGTSVLLLMSLYTAPIILFRVLQTKLHGFWMYFIIAIVHGIESIFDKITLPLQEYILHRCCMKGQHRHVSKKRKPRVNRLFADLAIVSMISESSAIIVSSVVLQICRYYYGSDEQGRTYHISTLIEACCWQVITGITVEFFFNTISIKIQTYYYNIPIIRVWKANKRWLIAMLLINTVIGILYFGDYFLNTLRSNKMFDNGIKLKCA